MEAIKEFIPRNFIPRNLGLIKYDFTNYLLIPKEFSNTLITNSGVTKLLFLKVNYKYALII